MKLFTLALLIGSVAQATNSTITMTAKGPAGEAIPLPLDGGIVEIRARFIYQAYTGVYYPQLSVGFVNKTSSPWPTLKLQFDIGGLCNGLPHQWSLPATATLGYLKEAPLPSFFDGSFPDLVGKVDGCKSEIIRVSVLEANSYTQHIEGPSVDPIDMTEELQRIGVQRQAEYELSLQAKQRSDEEQARQDAVEAAHQKQAEAEQKKLESEQKRAADTQRRKRAAAAAERKRKEASEAALRGIAKAAQDMKDAEERQRIRSACSAVYTATIDKKIRDLTVREEQQVRYCQALGFYPPQ